MRRRASYFLVSMTDRKIQIALGAWILVSPWILGFGSISFMKWSNVIIGTAIILINLWKVYGQSNPKP